MVLFLPFIFAFFFFTACAAPLDQAVDSATFSQDDTINIAIGKVIVVAEIADTEEERRLGLMYRRQLEKFQGMWFIFPNEAPRQFWMKNTLIPLDILYISNDFNIVHIIESAQPCEADPCRSYPSTYRVQYVLEVQGGFVQKHGVKIGDFVSVSYAGL